jgi:hypothetical protein
MILKKDTIQITLSDHLFWDIPPENLDLDKNRKLIIKRVLSRGNMEEVVQVYRYYGVEMVYKTITGSKDIDPLTLNLVKKLYNNNL